MTDYTKPLKKRLREAGCEFQKQGKGRCKDTGQRRFCLPREMPLSFYLTGVNETLQQAEASFERKYLPKRPIQELIQIVAVELGVRPQVICSGNRQKQYADARSLLAWLAVEEVGHPAAEVARFLGITRMGVHKAVMRGSELRRDRPALGQ